MRMHISHGSAEDVLPLSMGRQQAWAPRPDQLCHVLQVVYTTLIDGFVRVGDLESAQRMLQDMQACGLSPNTITFNILLRGICECLDRPVEVRAFPLTLKHIAASAAAAFCLPALAALLLLLQRMHHQIQCAPPLDTRGQSECEGSCLRLGPLLPQDALTTLRDMGMAGVVPSTDTFNTLMSACFSRGDPASVPHLFRRLISLGHSPDALSYTSLIAALTRIDRPKDAVSPTPIPLIAMSCDDVPATSEMCS